MELGENIRAIRKSKNLSQVGLACKLIVSNSFVCDLEKGRATPSMKTLRKIAAALEVEVKDLFA